MTRILVIESEIRSRHSLKTMLEGAGYEVELATDGSDAERMHITQPADLVIADLVDVDSRTRPFVGARVLAVPGGNLGREMGERTRAIGAQHFLPKPFRRDDLLAAVRTTLTMVPDQAHM